MRPKYTILLAFVVGFSASIAAHELQQNGHDEDKNQLALGCSFEVAYFMSQCIPARMAYNENFKAVGTRLQSQILKEPQCEFIQVFLFNT